MVRNRVELIKKKRMEGRTRKSVEELERSNLNKNRIDMEIERGKCMEKGSGKDIQREENCERCSFVIVLLWFTYYIST